MNSVELIGRLTRDPELSYTPANDPVAGFTLAVDRPKRDGKNQGADFISIVVFGRQAENCDRYLSKGRQVAIQGRIKTGSYTNREGKTVYTTDVVANSVEFLGGGQETQRQEQPQRQESAPTQMKINVIDMPDSFQQADDDMPF